MSFRSALGILLLIAAPGGASAVEPYDREEPYELEESSVASPALSAIRFSQPAAGATLHEGEIVEIRWSGVPADADEVELLLSVDGGRHFSLRLTEQLGARSGSYLWRVPALVTDNAALAIRVGLEGEEVTSAPGPLFHLSPGPSAAGAPLRWQGGEIWVESEVTRETPGPGAPTPPGLSADPARIAAVADDSDAVDLPRSSSLRARGNDREPLQIAHRDAGGTLRAFSPPRVPLSIPQRI